MDLESNDNEGAELPIDWSDVDQKEAPFSLVGVGLQGEEDAQPSPDYGSYEDFTREAYATGV